MGRPRSFDKTTALRAAELQFHKTGYAGTTLDDIAQATGLWRNSLRTAFGDKHGMLLESFEGYCSRSEADIVAFLAGPDGEALTRLESFIWMWAHAVLDDEDHLGCMATRFAVELNGSDPQIDERIKQDFTVVVDALSSCVEAAQRTGDLDESADPRAVACSVFCTTRGLDVAAKYGMPREDLEMVARQAAATLPRSRATDAPKVG
jgi:TetR/AcrR family transcriptional repressor of nem operon